MTKYTVTWAGMPNGQEYHTSRLKDAKLIAKMQAFINGHAEVTKDDPPYRDIYFDRIGLDVKEVEM